MGLSPTAQDHVDVTTWSTPRNATAQHRPPDADGIERTKAMRVFVVGASGAIGTRLVPS
jgi:hypothetical protein